MSHDELDRRILHELVQDARASYAEIGAVVGLSAPAVKRRVDRLRSDGAITGFSARLSPGELGWTTRPTSSCTAGAGRPPADIAVATRKRPEVISACTVTGEADALLHTGPLTCGTSSRSWSGSVPGHS